MRLKDAYTWSAVVQEQGGWQAVLIPLSMVVRHLCNHCLLSQVCRKTSLLVLQVLSRCLMVWRCQWCPG